MTNSGNYSAIYKGHCEPNHKRRFTRAVLPLLLLLTAAPVAQAAMECRDLALLRLPGTVITTATEVQGSFAPDGGQSFDVPAICHVRGTINPAIQFAVWLPEPGAYNGRLQAVGGGGLAGNISWSAMATAVGAGFASASTDTGHRSNDSLWLADPQRREDYGHRAIHEMTVKTKAIMAAYYGANPDYSYFNGCSTGGRQGLMEAQRYPGDYDGIVSGAPVFDFTRLHMGQLWTAHATLIPEGAVLSADDFNFITQAVMAQCDAEDGVEDGILTDPSTCDFNPRDLVCRGRSNDSCLTESQVGALESIYMGATNPRTGVAVYPGLEPGSENAQPANPGWGMLMNGRTPFFIDIPVLGGMGFENNAWDWRTFDFDRDVAMIDGKLANVLNAVNPDLRDFESQGSKIILWHGWNDPGVMPQRTIDYYDDLIAFAERAGASDGKAYVDDFARLYMLPGVGHCSGGVGPDQTDFMSAIVDWVENDTAPERVIASSRDGSMTRPLCPHPQVAVYDRGDTNDAASFVCE